MDQTAQSIYKRIAEIVSEVTGSELSDVTPSADLHEDLGMSEIEIAMLVSHIEDEFEILLPKRDVKRMMNVFEPVRVANLVELVLEEV